MTDPRTYAGTHTGSNPSPDGYCDDEHCGCNAVVPARHVGPVVLLDDDATWGGGGRVLFDVPIDVREEAEAGDDHAIARWADAHPDFAVDLDRIAPPYSYAPERDGDPIVCPGCETPEATPAMHNIEPGVCSVAIDIDRVIGSAGSYCDGCGCHLADEPHEEECSRGIDLATLRRIIGEPVEDAPLIVVTIRGGMVESIHNIPPGAVLEVRDYDVEQVDPSALVTDAEGREHSLAIHYGSGVVPRMASAADAFEAAHELCGAYDAAEESGSVEWEAVNDAQAAARRFVDTNA